MHLSLTTICSWELWKSIFELICPLAFVTRNKIYVTDNESDYAECDLDLKPDDHTPSSSDEMHSFGEGGNI